jgi:hypothetical protein
MEKSFLATYQRRHSLNAFFSTYWTVCASLHRKNSLERLIKWAKRKKLAPQQRYYQNQWIDEDNRVWRYQIRFPNATAVAKFAVCISDLISPAPYYPKKRYS